MCFSFTFSTSPIFLLNGGPKLNFLSLPLLSFIVCDLGFTQFQLFVLFYDNISALYMAVNWYFMVERNISKLTIALLARRWLLDLWLHDLFRLNNSWLISLQNLLFEMCFTIYGSNLARGQALA